MLNCYFLKPLTDYSLRIIVAALSRCTDFEIERVWSSILSAAIASCSCTLLVSAILPQVIFYSSDGDFSIDQDDFLPRTATPLEDIFKSLFW